MTDQTGTGTLGAWTNPANAEGASDSQYATISTSAGPTDSSDNLDSSDTVTSIPAGSTITQIEVDWYCYGDGQTQVYAWSLSLTDGTNSWGQAGTTTPLLPSSAGSFVGVTGTAGSGTLPTSMVTASGTLTIGSLFSVGPASGAYGVTANVDSIGYRITYTAPSAGGPVAKTVLITQAVNRASTF